MAASGSVFAQQFAGKVRQIGKDGEVIAAGGPKAKAQIVAPSSRPKASAVSSAAASHVQSRDTVPAGKAKAKAKAKPAQAKAQSRAETPQAEAGEEDGGVMKCANRDLLRQMLQNADTGNDTADDLRSEVSADLDAQEDAPFSMSMRLIPGTPLAGTQRRASNVPTITSPAGSRAPPQVLSAPMRAVSSASAPSLAPKVKASPSGVITGPPKATIPVPVPKVVTGPPQPVNVAPLPARPGSRGGPPTTQTMVSPTHRAVETKQITANAGGRSTPSGYGAIHAARGGIGSRGGRTSPAGKAGSAAAKPGVPASRPLCGPSGFDMLRQRDGPKTTQTLLVEDDDDHDLEAVVDEGPRGLADAGHRGNDSFDASQQDSFMMPAGSDISSDDGGHRDRLADVDAGGPGEGAPESAADYVERVKRSMGVGSAATAAQASSAKAVPVQKPIASVGNPEAARSVEPQAAPVQRQVASARSHDVARVAEPHARASRDVEPAAAAAAPQPRARSSDPRSAVAAARAAEAQVRAQSSEPRGSVSFARDIDGGQGDGASVQADDSDDDDGPVVGRAGGEPWKSDIRAMVKDFAREERARCGAAPRSGGNGPAAGKAPAPVRPPKAPPNASAPRVPRRSLEPEVEKQTPQAQENVPPGEQLFFSKKPRDVDYQPASLEDFKQKGYGKKEYSEIKPTLGPDLDDEDLLMKRAVQEKKKQFSKELQRINRHRIASREPKVEPKPEPKPNARSKAQEFAKNVPKPKPPSAARPPPERKAKEAKEAEPAQDQADWDEIQRREQQHFADVLRVKDIKDYLTQLPY